MGDAPRMTTPVVKVVSAMLASPDDDRYGLELMHDTGLASGTLYPVLVRLEAAGWIESRWEAIDPVAEGRPARRYHRLTPIGAASARAELAAMRHRLSRATATLGRVARA